MTQNPQGPQQQGPKGARPGAMTMAMAAVGAPVAGPKVLRIMVAQGVGVEEKVIEEKIVRTRETVSIGSGVNNHFVVNGMPTKFEFFQLVGNDYILNFTEEMSGRVGLPGGVQELAQLRASGAARNAGQYWQVKLTDSSKGQVRIGQTRILFQFVDPPPVQPKPQLPAAVMGGMMAGIDWVFTFILAASFMMLFGSIVFLENWDWPMQQGVAEIPERLAEMIFNEPEPPPEPEPENNTTQNNQPEQPTERPRERAPANNQQQQQQSSGETRQAAQAEARMAAEEAAASVEHMLATAMGEGGALRDVLAGGAVTGSADDVLAQATGVGVAAGASTGLREASGGGRAGGVTGGLGGLAAAGGGGARNEGGPVQEAGPRGRFRAPADADDEQGSGDFDARVVTRMIQTRQSAIKACYERELRQNPNMQGSVRIRLTIQESGSVSGVSAIENTTGNANVGSCVARVVQGFRFNPGPEGGSVTYVFPFVFEPQS